MPASQDGKLAHFIDWSGIIRYGPGYSFRGQIAFFHQYLAEPFAIIWVMPSLFM